MATLQARITNLISAIGADVKSVLARLTVLENRQSTTPKMYAYTPAGWPTVDASDVMPRWFYSGGYPAAPNPASIPAIASVLKVSDFWDYDEASTVA